MAGYLYQARYALLLGLQEARHHPGYALSLETFDDVALQDADGPIRLIQTKHHSRHTAVSDRSVDLWKTLDTWIRRVNEEPTAAASTRLLFLTTNTAAAGSALSLLRKATGVPR